MLYYQIFFCLSTTMHNVSTLVRETKRKGGKAFLSFDTVNKHETLFIAVTPTQIHMCLFVVAKPSRAWPPQPLDGRDLYNRVSAATLVVAKTLPCWQHRAPCKAHGGRDSISHIGFLLLRRKGYILGIVFDAMSSSCCAMYEDSNIWRRCLVQYCPSALLRRKKQQGWHWM